MIYLDTYRQPYIPFYLSTREFFALARDRLAPGGSIVINVGHPEGNDELERVLSATMGDSFRFVARDPVNATSTVLIGSQTRPTPRPPAGGGSAPARRRCARSRWAKLRGSRRACAAATVYTDDKAPVEWLIDKSIVEYAAGGEG